MQRLQTTHSSLSFIHSFYYILVHVTLKIASLVTRAVAVSICFIHSMILRRTTLDANKIRWMDGSGRMRGIKLLSAKSGLYMQRMVMISMSAICIQNYC